MYAKLVFPANTSAGSRNRDIARIIHESSSGTASLNNLEFASAATSEFYPGVNSGWSLADSGTINAGAITSADGRYIFEGSCVDSNKKKYLAVSVHGLYTSTTVLDSPYPGTIIQPIIDKGLATENYIYGSDITTPTSLQYSSVGYTYSTPAEVYIFATPRKLVLIGGTGNSTNINVDLYVLMHLEYEENGMSQYFNIVPQTLIAYALGGLSNGFTPTNATQGSYYGAAAYDNTTLDMVCFPKSMVWGGSVARVLTLTENVGNGYDLLHSAIDWAYNTLIFTENGTASGLYSSTTPLKDEMLGNPRQFYNSYKKWNIGMRSSDNYGMYIGRKKNLSGKWTFPLYPIYCKFDQLNTGIISYAHTNVYHGPNIGLTNGSDIKINNDYYKYFCAINQNNYSASLIIKRE
jgi:hypothetical protein